VCAMLVGEALLGKVQTSEMKINLPLSGAFSKQPMSGQHSSIEALTVCLSAQLDADFFAESENDIASFPRRPAIHNLCSPDPIDAARLVDVAADRDVRLVRLDELPHCMTPHVHPAMGSVEFRVVWGCMGNEDRP
jgi:hypothetical protein